MPNPVKQQCPACAEVQEVTAWQSLNVTLNPDIKPRVLEGSLFEFHCQKCGLRADMTYSMLYHDMEKHLMIYLMPDGPNEEWRSLEAATAGTSLKDFQLRRVETWQELAEKVREFDCGLDDRVVELFKPTVFSEPGERTELQLGALVFHGKGKPLPSGEATYGFHGTVMGQFAALSVGASRYEECRAKAGKDLPPFESLKGTWHRIGSAPPAMNVPPNFRPDEMAQGKPPTGAQPPGPSDERPGANPGMPPPIPTPRDKTMGRVILILLPIFVYVFVLIPASERGETIGWRWALLAVAVFGCVKGLLELRAKKD